MSDFGLQTFINGTSFDVVNNMDFNYVVDVFYINAGSGSRSYPNLPGVSLSMSGMNMIETYSGDGNFTFSTSGKSISWNSNVAMLAVIYASPTDSSSGGDGYTFAVSVNGRLKMAPDFTPLCLNSVRDYGSGTMTITTTVPASSPFMAFHRGSTALDAVTMVTETSGGYWRIRVTRNLYGFRLYTFSDIPVNPPEYGFFLYRNGSIVWHSNCLPLRMLSLGNGPNGPSSVTSANPLAVSASHSVRDEIVSAGNLFTQIFYATSAGVQNGTWRVDARGYAYNQNMNTTVRMGAARVPNIPYIDCSVYDQYYQYSLG